MSLRTSASHGRLWLAMLLVTLTRRATELGCLRLPFVEEVHATPPGTRDKRTREQITSTGIVILGLLEVIFAGFLVGCTQSGLHPVWRGIITIAVIGIIASAMRIRRLIKGKARRGGAVGTTGADEVWTGIAGAPRKAEA
jgi:hypothetical protein